MKTASTPSAIRIPTKHSNNIYSSNPESPSSAQSTDSQLRTPEDTFRLPIWESYSTTSSDEPFGVLATRADPYLIGLPSAGRYDRYLRGSVKTDNLELRVFTNTQDYLPKTPQTALTFAAVWDPEVGMSTFRGRLLDGDPPFEIEESTCSSPSIYPSSQYSFDDEGYYETFSQYGHPDCEPHLPSRFSTSTTSTSNYVEVDPSEVECFARAPFPEAPMTPTRNGYCHSESHPEISPPFMLMPAPHRHPTSPSKRVAQNLLRSVTALGSHEERSPTPKPRLDRSSTCPSRPSTPDTPTQKRFTRLSLGVLSKFKHRRSESSEEGWVGVDAETLRMVDGME